MDKLKVGRVLIGLTFSVAAWAQGLSTINGSVADPSGSVIPAAKITVIEVETSLPRKAVTNAEGNFVISSLRPTHYRMIVEAPGFRTFNQTGITLLADDSITFNVKLELGSTTENSERGGIRCAGGYDDRHAAAGGRFRPHGRTAAQRPESRAIDSTGGRRGERSLRRRRPGADQDIPRRGDHLGQRRALQ